MAATEPIEISSSDSEWDITEDDIAPEIPASTRRLPNWPEGPGTSSRNAGNGIQTQKVPSPKRSYALNGSSSSANSNARMKVQDTNLLNRQADDSRYLMGSVIKPPAVNPRIANVLGTDYERLSSPQALRRTLPPTLQPSAPGIKSLNIFDDANGTRVRNTYGNAYAAAGLNLTNSRGNMRDRDHYSDSQEIVIYEPNESRILPQSLMQGRPSGSSQFPGSSDSLYRSGVTEDRASASDERLVYQAALQDLNQPKVEATLPEGFLSVPLLRHQKIALAWMLQKETRSLHCLGGILADDQGLGKTISMIALIQMQKSLLSKSENQCNIKREALNLDEDDDLDRGKKTGECEEIKSIPEVSTSTRAFNRQRPAAGTLVVCPASILRQWFRELDDKVADGAKLSVLIYHGGNRTKDPSQLAKWDVVLTTYAIVTNEVPKQPAVDEEDADEKSGERYGLSSAFSTDKKRKKVSTSNKNRGRKGAGSSADSGSGPLARVGWFRVILDEAQTIKNHRTQVARACCSLRAKRRWCLSGTPIQNTIDDLYSYFRFLRYDPYATYKSFYSTIKVPIAKNSLHGYKKLQAVLRAIMLRRTKGTLIDGEPIINLPPKTICLTKVDFSAEERGFYTRLEADSRSKFKAYAAAGTLNQNYANILLMLLRLRQACDHPLLVKGFNSDSAFKDSTKMANMLPRDMVNDLLNHLATAICLVCSDTPDDPVVTMCGHVFCYQCVSEFVTGDDNMCPAPRCKEQLGSDVVFSEAILKSCVSDNIGSSSMHRKVETSTVLQNEYSSSKIRAVLEHLQKYCLVESPSSGPLGETSTSSQVVGPIKAIIFSQWTGMLDLVGASLEQYCIQYRRLDGTMSLNSRDRAVKDFNTDPEVTVMIMSLKAGNLGLNMVAASHVILLDLWWNPTTEDQAVDRAHRIGQTRPVTVTRLTIKDTVEDRILMLQEEKRKMVASAFGEDHSGGTATRLTVEDLKYLFMV